MRNLNHYKQIKRVRISDIFKYELIEKNAIIEFSEKMDFLKKFDIYKGV